MSGYYEDKLAAEKLRRCYEVAPPRARAYLESEIDFVASRILPGAQVLELGCGYGRVLTRIAARAGLTVGIDTSAASIAMAAEQVASAANTHLLLMDATALGLRPGSFDLVCCIQNGISAFHADPQALVSEAFRVVCRSGRVLFSSYAECFWPARLEWFEIQAQHGLIGEIDYDATGDGIIVCKDGFTATTFGPDEFRRLTAGLDADIRLHEVGGASLFCEIVRR